MAVWLAVGVLALVMAWAAVAKLGDRPGAREAAVGLGVPAGAAAPVALALPALELGSAVLLVVPPTRRAGAALALVLLVAFSAAIAATLRAGRRPACHCFGARSSAPIGPDALARNAALGALALVVLVG